MIVTCPSCATRFVLDDALLAPSGRKVRCSNCKKAWRQSYSPEPVELRDIAPEAEAKRRAAVSAGYVDDFEDGVVTEGFFDAPPPKPRGSLAAPLFVTLSFLGVMLIGAYAFRAPLAAAVPALEPVLSGYGGAINSALGKAETTVARVTNPPPPPPLTLREARYDFEQVESGRALLVQAIVENGSEAPQTAPLLSVRLLDDSGAVLFEAPIPPEDNRGVIDPAAAAPYFLRLMYPPDETRDVVVELDPDT